MDALIAIVLSEGLLAAVGLFIVWEIAGGLRMVTALFKLFTQDEMDKDDLKIMMVLSVIMFLDLLAGVYFLVRFVHWAWRTRIWFASN